MVVTHERLFTPKQVANYLGVCVDTVRRHMLDGTLPAYKIGGTYRAYKSEVDAVIKTMKAAKGG